ncbi:unnamed protein product [Schistosoma margrebowiei]|uniref:Uncharacterized protein n=1 Tax=Schistosoma margrebowiei TaxID=48269 RepID=A0A183MNB2_9TREM|nr:unnamed protein product [Schistosoma margrebowiei]
MRRYNLELLGISETHWTQVGQQRLTSGELLLYSGHDKENAPHTQGVALMLSKQAQNALIGWESHGPRIIKASFKTKKKGISLNIIQCYAPTNYYNEDAKDQFYNRLQSIVEKCQTKDLTILMGHFNAKVGTDNTGYEDIMGRHGLGERNVNLCAFNKLVIGTTVESNLKGIKEAITSTCHQVLGHKKHHHKEWITVDTLNKIQERRNNKAAVNTSRTRSEKSKAQVEYTGVNKQVKRSIRTDKRKYVEDLATTAEKAAREGNMRQLWLEHFKELLNRPAPLNPPNIDAAPTDLPINVGPPTIEEISKDITQIKSGKAAGSDNIPTEALKADIIVEQSIEWNSSLYINFIDYEKAFDSVDKTKLWKLLRHYGVPQKIVNIIQSSYDGLHCKIVHGGQLTKSFEVKTGVR